MIVVPYSKAKSNKVKNSIMETDRGERVKERGLFQQSTNMVLI